MQHPVYDYVVVGGGSSGSIVAAELARGSDARVLLLEHGPAAEEHPETLEADGYKQCFANDALMWSRFSEPQQRAGKQRLYLGTGRGMGGSGSVNGMVYTRGAKLDFDAWPVGWRWSDLERVFVAVEERLRVRRRTPTRFTEACIAAACEAGFRRKDDLNDGDLSGVLGYEWMSYEGTKRRSAYVAFLKEPGIPANLTVETHATGRRIRFDADKRAVGIDYERGGEPRSATVRREVILCSGALESPKLLMVSGVGPGAALRSLGIDVVHDQPNVGRNLHDHPNVTLFYLGENEVDCYYPQLYGFHRANPALPLPKEQSDSCYVFYPARSSFREAAGRMLPAKMLSPSAHANDTVRELVRRAVDLPFRLGPIEDFVAKLYGIVVILGKPMSRGSLRLRSADPADQAIIDPAYFDRPEDMETMLRAVRLAQRIGESPSLSAWGNRKILPAKWMDGDSAIQKFVEAQVMTTFHFAGTCTMGDGDECVVDRALRVKGVRGVRVADASAVPFTPVSAMNAPSMAIGYRAAELVKADADR